MGPDNLSLGLVSMQNVVSTGDGGTSSSTLHNATFVSEPGSIIGSEPMSSLDLNVNGCNDLDSLSNVNIGSDQLITSSSALSATNINIIVPLIPTPIPHPAFEQYHYNEIINDILRTLRRLNHNILIIRVRQMNTRRAVYGIDVPVPSAFMPTWFELLIYYCLMEESEELYYSPPVIPPLRPNVTFLYMKPIELIFLQGANLFTNYYPQTLWPEIISTATPAIERTERVRMALEDNPIHQFHANLEYIDFNGLEQIHSDMVNLNYSMEVPNDQHSPHPEEVDISLTNSLSRELENVCSTMFGAFVYKGYVCYNGGTTIPQYIERCDLWGPRYYRYPGWSVDKVGTPFENNQRVRFSQGSYNNAITLSNGPPTDGNNPPPGNNEPANTGNIPTRIHNNQLNNNNTSNTNNYTTGSNSSNINQSINTTTNPMQANIRSRMTDFLTTNIANDDVSSVSSEESKQVNDPLPAVEQQIMNPITIIIPGLNTSTEADDNSSTDTEVVMDRAPRGRRGEALIPPKPRKIAIYQDRSGKQI